MFFRTDITTEIEVAADWLRRGECVGIPTETVYGLAANALDPAAVVKIFEAKNRPAFDPLIVHVKNLAEAERFSTDFPAPLRRLAERFWPGPLTILLPKSAEIPDLVTSGLPRVGLRLPAHPRTRALLEALPFPLAAPSANPFGYISPTTAEHVVAQLGGKIPCVLEGGDCSVGVESTIVGFENGAVRVYRLGGLPIETIENEVGAIEVALNMSSNPAAPGMLASHYAPRKPLFFIENASDLPAPLPGEKLGLLTFSDLDFQLPDQWRHYALSPSGDLGEAAKNLFSTLRALDTADVDRIFALHCPDEGLGRAINDRLRRAAWRAGA